MLTHDLIERGHSQFIIATHSPLLMTYPGAEIINFDRPELEVIPLDDTSHYQITCGMLDDPSRYWTYLLNER